MEFYGNCPADFSTSHRGNFFSYDELNRKTGMGSYVRMTSFLPAGIINETLEEICEKITRLKEMMDAGENEQAKRGLIELEETALGLWDFIEKFTCQPLIYTGMGNTDEIIRRLEWALTFTEEFDPAAFKKSPSSRKHRVR